MNVTTATPVEIDTEIFRLLQLAWDAQDKLNRLDQSAHRAAGDRKHGHGNYWGLSDADAWTKVAAITDRWEAEHAQKLIADRDAAKVELDVIRAEIKPLDAEYFARGTWTRAYLVDNADGHVHNTDRCSSFRLYTRYHWLTELSGQAESEIVELAGERACTICYASAPVDVFKRPSKLEGPAQIKAREEKARKEAEKARKAAEAINVKIIEFGHPREHTFKTVRGATNFIANELSSLTWYGETHPSAAEWKTNVASIREALAAKGVSYDFDKALAAARKKAVRDGGQAKF